MKFFPIFVRMETRCFFAALTALCIAAGHPADANAVARNTVYNSNIKSLQTVVGDDWLSPPVMTLNSDETLYLSFDELSHDYHRFIYHIDHCEADWTVSEEIFESDYLRGFNDNPIEDYDISVNTTVPYTHYMLEIPNEKCRLTLSGNYRITVTDEDGEKMFDAEFMITEKKMSVGLEVSTNTDIDKDRSHQQVTMKLNYEKVRVTNPNTQIYTIVTQNDNPAVQRVCVKPNVVSAQGLEWTHRREFIFDAGNEYHKFEALDLSHTTMGLESVEWDGEHFIASPFIAEERKNYLYDEDANGAFYIRNSDNIDNDFTSDYFYARYRLKSPFITKRMRIQGRWTTDADKSIYDMSYDGREEMYTATILQKQGYYSYRFVAVDTDGTESIPPTEGNFYQTENRYQAYVYFKGTGERTWRLVAYRQQTFK